MSPKDEVKPFLFRGPWRSVFYGLSSQNFLGFGLGGWETLNPKPGLQLIVERPRDDILVLWP